jgi:hypothetical protein
MTRVNVTDVRFAPASAPFRSKGLLGWVCAQYGDLQLDGLRVLRSPHGRYSLGFPSHIDGNGLAHAYYRPLNQAARHAIEASVLGELRRRGKLPDRSVQGQSDLRMNGASDENGSTT